jgi:tetratricopeptide (TPR) repeat protein
MQKQLQKAAYLNMEGVTRLNSGDSDGAYDSFKLALDVMTDLRKEQEVKALIHNSWNPSGCTVGAHQQQLIYTTRTAPHMNKSDTFYVYDQVLVFTPNDDDDDADSSSATRSRVAFCSACVIFNIALTYHQRAMQYQPQEALFIHASHLYNQVLELVNDFSLTSLSDFLVLEVLARNNHAQICSMMGEYNYAKQGLEQLRKLIHSGLPSLEVI